MVKLAVPGEVGLSRHNLNSIIPPMTFAGRGLSAWPRREPPHLRLRTSAGNGIDDCQRIIDTYLPRRAELAQGGDGGMGEFGVYTEQGGNVSEVMAIPA